MIRVSVQKTLLHSPSFYNRGESEVLLSDLVAEYLDAPDNLCVVVVDDVFVSPEQFSNTVIESGDIVYLSVRQEFEVAWYVWVLYAGLAYVGYTQYEMEIPDTGEGANEKQVRINGMRNIPRKYEPLPVVLGKHRVSPDWLAEPYVETVGEEQYYNLLLCGGYGPQELEDFRIGDTEVGDYDNVNITFTGSSNLFGIPYLVGSAQTSTYVRSVQTVSNQLLRRAWPNDITQERVNVELAEDAPITRTTQASVAAISLDFNNPAGLLLVSDERQRNTGYWLDITATETDTTDAFKVTQVIEFDSTSSTRYGAYTGNVYRDIITGDFYLCKFGFGMNGRVTDGISGATAGYHALRGTDITTYSVPSTGAETIAIPAGQIKRYSPEEGTISISADWAEAPIVKYPVADKTKKPFRVSVKHDFYDDDTLKTYDVSVEIRKVNGADAVAETNTLALSCFWELFTGNTPLDTSGWLELVGNNKPEKIINDSGDKEQVLKPVVVAVRIKASNQLSGMLDKLNYRATSMVPVDWNSDWREITTLDDEDLKTTENPADIYRLFLQAPFNAVALPNDKIDLDGLLAWRDFCDLGGGTVEDGFAPFRTSGLLREKSTLLKELNKIAFTGRAQFSFVDGKYGVAIKELQDTPVQQFTPKNSWGFSSARSFPEDNDGIKYEFRNEDVNYEQDEGIFLNPDKIEAQRKGLYSSVDLPYVADADLATRHARFGYFENRLRREVYSLETDIEGLKCTRGDLVRVQNDIIDVGLNSGRVTSSAGTTFFLDETDQLVAGNTYGISTRGVNTLSSGTARYEGGQEWTVLTGSNPAVDDLIAYGTAGIETLECIVTEVTYGNDLAAKLTLVNHATSLFTIDDGSLPTYETNLTPRIAYKRPGAPSLILPSTPAEFATGVARIRFISNSDQDSPIKFFSLEAVSSTVNPDEAIDDNQLPNPWKVIGVTTAAEAFVDIELGLDNFWKLRGRAVGENDLYSPYSDVENLLIPQGPAANVTALTLEELVNTPKTPDANLSTIVARVTPPVDSAYSHSIIRYRKVGQFEFVTQGRTGTVSEDRADIVVPSDGIQYEVTATSVSIFGVYSEDSVSTFITVYDVRNDPLKEEIKIPNVKGLEIFEQGNDTEFVGRDVEFNWRNTSVNEWTPIGQEPGQGVDFGGLDQYFRDYEIQMFDAAGNLLSVHYSAINTFTYTYEQNRQDYKKLNGVEGANRTIRADVRIRGRNNQFSEKSARLTVSNPAPSLPTLIPYIGFTTVSFGYTPPADRDFAGVKLWLSDTEGFTPEDEVNLVHPLSPSTAISVDGLNTESTYYVVYQAFDDFGEGPTSDEFSLTTKTALEFEGLSGWAYEVDPADRAFIEENLAADAIPSTKIENLTVAKLTAGVINATETITTEGLIRAVDDINDIELQVGIGPAVIGSDVYLMWAHDPVLGVIFGVQENGDAELGSITINATGNIRAGKTGFSDFVNAGFWMGNESEVAKAHIGSSSNYITFDGTDLVLAVDKLGAGAANAGDNSLALGSGSSASGDNSMAIGVGSESGALNSISIGRDSSSSTTNSIALGRSSNASGDNSISAGTSAQSVGLGAIALGNSTVANGGGTVSIGYLSSTVANISISIGNGATTTGGSSVTIGSGASSSQLNAVSIGASCAVNGSNSILVGAVSNTQSNNTVVLGQGSSISTSSDNSIVIGRNVTLATSRPNSIVMGDSAVGFTSSVTIGQSASAGSTESVVIGKDATTSSNSANSVVIGRNATLSGSAASSVVIGDSSTGGFNSVALGRNASAGGNQSTAVGRSSSSSGSGSTAIGNLANVTGSLSSAFGDSATATASNTAAFGAFSQATHTNSTAVGHAAATTAQDQVVLGTVNRQVVIPGTMILNGGANNTTGSYAFLHRVTNSVALPGATVAGSDLRYTAAFGAPLASPVPTGSWRCMGRSDTGGNENRTTLWVKIA